jgi:hypothetical protein
MRIDKRSSRTLGILFDDAVPRRTDGALALCQDCQRLTWYAGGYTSLLANRLAWAADEVTRIRRHIRKTIEMMDIGDRFQSRVGHTACFADMVRAVAFSKEWTLRCQRWTDGRVIVWRLA